MLSVGIIEEPAP